MSMLAERKVKQKWSLNPRGKDWAEDQNKFGQKMLEKMGWSKGKGLGAKENGVTEHIKIPYKNDSKGMGYKETNDQWTEHDSQFNELLKNLKETNGVNIEKSSNGFVSLELKSQSSKKRVHYKKFTRGKDLSRCTEKDLAQIFGKKTFTPNKEETQEKSIENGEISDNQNFTYKTISMKDYFKKKLPNFGKSNGYEVGNNGVLKKADSEDEEFRCGFGFRSSPLKEVHCSSDSIEKKIEKNKKKRKAEDHEQQSKKIKLENGISNPAFNPFNKIEVNKHTLERIEEIEGEVTEQQVNEKKKMEEINNSTLENEQSLSDSTTKASKKKKKKIANESLALDNPVFTEVENGVNEDSINNSQFEVKRKKKKKKNNENLAVENFGFDVEELNKEENTENNENFEVKRKNKRKIEENLEVDNVAFSESFEDASNETTNTNFEIKRKKKKKNKNEETPNGNINPSFKDSPEKVNLTLDEPVIDDDLMLNVITTPILKATPSNGDNKRKKAERKKSVRFSNVNEEKIIPNVEDLKKLEEIEKRKELFDINEKVIKNGLNENEFLKKIDQAEAEIENDINEAKDSNGDSQRKNSPKGPVHLRYAEANLKSPRMKIKESENYAKKSYRHLIKGDIILTFKNTNLGKIKGYATEKRKKKHLE